MEQIQATIEEFVDYLMPSLSPHEASLYLFLLRHSHMAGNQTIRIGQRTIAQKYGRGPKNSVPSRTHVLRQLKSLQEKGCLRVGDTNREGTLYTIFLPTEIPLVKEARETRTVVQEDDFFTNPEKRSEIYERDNWICAYCGDKLTRDNVTLDHYIPQSKGGPHGKDNLRTCCLSCNSVKSGKTYEEAAPYLLSSIQQRRSNRNR